MCAAIEQLSPDLSKTSGLKKTKKKNSIYQDKHKINTRPV